jgi:hypothetical protein
MRGPASLGDPAAAVSFSDNFRAVRGPASLGEPAPPVFRFVFFFQSAPLILDFCLWRRGSLISISARRRTAPCQHFSAPPAPSSSCCSEPSFFFLPHTGSVLVDDSVQCYFSSRAWVWVHSWISLQVLVVIRVFAPFSCARPSDAGTDFCDCSACRVSSAGQGKPCFTKASTCLTL